MRVTLPALLARTGSLPETFAVPPKGMYKTLRDARKSERGPVALFPEGTTGNGRAVLRFGEGVLAEADIGSEQEGTIWIKFIKYVTRLKYGLRAFDGSGIPRLLRSPLAQPVPPQHRSNTSSYPFCGHRRHSRLAM